MVQRYCILFNKYFWKKILTFTEWRQIVFGVVYIILYNNNVINTFWSRTCIVIERVWRKVMGIWHRCHHMTVLILFYFSTALSVGYLFYAGKLINKLYQRDQNNYVIVNFFQLSCSDDYFIYTALTVWDLQICWWKNNHTLCIYTI